MKAISILISIFFFICIKSFSQLSIKIPITKNFSKGKYFSLNGKQYLLPIAYSGDSLYVLNNNGDLNALSFSYTCYDTYDIENNESTNYDKTALKQETLRFYDVLLDGRNAFIGTNDRIYKVDNNTIFPLGKGSKICNQSVYYLEKLGDHIWYKSAIGIGKIEGNYAWRWETSGWSNIINYFNNRVWFVINYVEGNDGLGYIDDFPNSKDPKAHFGLQFRSSYNQKGDFTPRNIYGSKVINNQLWLHTNDGLYVVSDTVAVLIYPLRSKEFQKNFYLAKYADRVKYLKGYDKIIYKSCLLELINKSANNQSYDYVIPYDSIVQYNDLEGTAAVLFDSTDFYNNYRSLKQYDDSIVKALSEFAILSSNDIKRFLFLDSISKLHYINNLIKKYEIPIRSNEAIDNPDLWSQKDIIVDFSYEGRRYSVPEDSFRLDVSAGINGNSLVWRKPRDYPIVYLLDRIHGRIKFLFNGLKHARIESDPSVGDYERVVIYTDKGLYKATTDTVYFFTDKIKEYNNYEVTSSVFADDQNNFFTIYHSNEGFFKQVKNDIFTLKSLQLEDFKIKEIRTVKRFEDDYWLLTDIGAFYLHNNSIQRIPDFTLEVKNISYDGLYYWLESDDLIYKVYPKAKIDVSFHTENSSWKNILSKVFGSDILISGFFIPEFSYNSADEFFYAMNKEKIFDYIISSDSLQFINKVRNNRYNAAGTGFNIAPGRQTLYIQIRDKHGNVFYIKKTIVVWPSAYVFSILVVFFWVGVLSFLFFFSPYSKFCHNVLMNPWVRNYGSFGLIPLLISLFPGLRNYLLKRYYNSILGDPEIVNNYISYVIPENELELNSFNEIINNKRKVLFIGQSGIGKSAFFKYLTYSYSKLNSTKIFNSLKIPMFIPLSRYAGYTPDDIFISQLEKYGLIHDKKLSEWFLKQGGFILLLDGLNEIEEVHRNTVNSFVDKNWKQNYICLSSQQVYPEFQWLEILEFKPLTLLQIERILEKHLPVDKANKAINYIANNKLIEIYSIPQNLLFAIDAIKSNNEISDSLLSLYDEVFEPIKNKWVNEGAGDYPDILSKRAFEMLSNKIPFLNSKNFEALPDKIITHLFNSKLIIKSGENLLFKHDIVRSYFASSYFLHNLKFNESEVFKNKPDKNWLTMLEFCFIRINNIKATEALLNILLTYNPVVAGDFYNLLKTKYQMRFDVEFTDSFVSTFGKYFLELS